METLIRRARTLASNKNLTLKLLQNPGRRKRRKESQRASAAKWLH